MAYENLIVEITDHVCLIKLNRPKALNALNSQLVAELSDAVRQAETNDKVRCVIISGCDKAFAAGADISEMSEKTFVDVVTDDLFGASLLPIQNANKPIIASVAGYALGGGCELAMMCDFIICADNAKFGQPEINLGVIAGIGGTQRLTRFVGKSKSMDMNLTGRFMNSDEAERCGLVSQVFPKKTLMKEVLAIAAKIAEKPLTSSRMIKESVNRSFEVPLSEGLLFERRLFHSLFATDDQTEGMNAFVEKREPRFRDK